MTITEHVEQAEQHLHFAGSDTASERTERYNLAAAGIHGLLALVAAVRSLREDAS